MTHRRGTAALVVVAEPAAWLPDDPALVALHTVACRAQGVWVGRAGEAPAGALPVRRRLVEAPSTVRAVSTALAHAAAAEAAPGAMVLVYGHSLHLVPAILRRSRPDLRVGCYLPTELPTGDPTVLRGLLGADLLGFQTAFAAESFLRRCQDATDRPPSVGVFPTSVQTPAIAALAASPEVARTAAALRTRLGDPRTVILTLGGRDPGVRDPSQGVMVALPRVSLAERVAYYQAADVLVASRRDWATTVAQEFAAGARDDAAILLTEPAGLLADAHRFDPVNVPAGVAVALADPQRAQRLARMRANVTAYHTFTWAGAFLRTLRATPSRATFRAPAMPQLVRAGR